MIICYYCWLVFFGDFVYEFILFFNCWLNYWWWCWGYGYWLLLVYFKYKVKIVVNFISDFEEVIVYECYKCGFDGVVCGYIYYVEICCIEGVDYFNCGDWVEFCMVLIEYWDGSI